MAVGAASATIVNTGLAKDASPTDAFTHSMPGWISALTLLAIAVGAVSANVLNIYSGAMSFLAMGIRIGYRLRRAIVAVVFGVAGGIIAYAYLGDPAAYENFLLIIAYWIGPWLGVVFVDRWMRRGDDAAITAVAEDPTSTNWAGPIAMLIGLVVSVWLFSNQANYVGPVPTANPSFGDSTFFVGFLLSRRLLRGARAGPPADLGARPQDGPSMIGLDDATARSWLATAVAEARAGLAEGGIPIGGALYSATGELLGSGHNRRVQDDDPSVHGETDAFRRAGRQRTYAGSTMVTTLSPCWYCSGLVRQFGISRVVVGEAHDVLRRARVAGRERRRGARARRPGVHLDDDRLHRRTARPLERGHRGRRERGGLTRPQVWTEPPQARCRARSAVLGGPGAHASRPLR